MIFADLLARTRLIPREVARGRWIDIGGYSSNHHQRCRTELGLPSPTTTNVKTNSHLDLPSVFASCTALPFSRKSFDYATIIDVLEHLSSPDRLPTIREAARVARHLVIIGPFRNRANVAMEARVLRLLEEHQETMPGLEEHRRFGLPTLREVRRLVEFVSPKLEMQFASSREAFETGIAHQLHLPASERSSAADRIATHRHVHVDQAYRYVIRVQAY